MAGRPQTFDENEVLKKASDLFWTKGYTALGTEELITTVGMQRGSFYNAFKSKKNLFIKAMEFHENEGFSKFEELLKQSDDPIETIRFMFRSIADCEKNEHSLGCLMGNTLAELSNIDSNLADHARKHLKYLEQAIEQEIANAQNVDTLKNKTSPSLIARILVNFWNGINITRRMYPDKKELLPLIEEQLKILY